MSGCMLFCVWPHVLRCTTKKEQKIRSNSSIKKVITFNIMCCVLVLFTSGTWRTMQFAKPVAFWFYLRQENVHVVCKDCCVLVLFASGKRPCGLQSLLCSGFVCVRKMSMCFAKPIAFWFCLHRENIHVVWKAHCLLVLFASGKCPCGLQSLLCSGFVCIRKTSMWFAKPVVLSGSVRNRKMTCGLQSLLCSVLFASGKWPCGLQSLDSVHPCLLQKVTQF